jgi:hypothetical protein
VGCKAEGTKHWAVLCLVSNCSDCTVVASPLQILLIEVQIDLNIFSCFVSKLHRTPQMTISNYLSTNKDEVRSRKDPGRSDQACLSVG